MTMHLLGPSLLGLGAEHDVMSIQASSMDGFLLQNPTPSSAQIAEYLKHFYPEDRGPIARELIVRGVDESSVNTALHWLDVSSKWTAARSTIFKLLAVTSMAASTYHGYKRNKSIGWALVWGLSGGLFPVITPVIAVAQGFAKPKAR